MIMTPRDLSTYKVPVSIFEATDRVKREQEKEAICKENQEMVVCSDEALQEKTQERKINFSYRFLF